MRQPGEDHPGMYVAAILAGAWRADPPLLRLTPEEITEALPHLLRSTAAALAWRRVRSAGLHASRWAKPLREAYRAFALETAQHEQNLKVVAPLLRAAGVEPILIKGWSVARLYPEPGLRPYCDLDLCVQPDKMPAATDALLAGDVARYLVELHKGIPDLKGRTWADIYRRTRLARLGDEDVRVLCPEDEFRLLCLHQMRHGACTPLWLCDLAAALDARPADFDWDLCLRGGPALSAWIIAFARLAGQLLGARLDGPAAVPPGEVPDWLGPTVLARWARPLRESHLLDPIKIAHRWQLSPGLSLSMTQFLGLAGRVAEAPTRLWRQWCRWWRPDLPFMVHAEAGD